MGQSIEGTRNFKNINEDEITCNRSCVRIGETGETRLPPYEIVRRGSEVCFVVFCYESDAPSQSGGGQRICQPLTNFLQQVAQISNYHPPDSPV